MFTRLSASSPRRTVNLSGRRLALAFALISLAAILAVFLPVSLFSIRQVIQQSEVLDTEKEMARVRGILDNELSQINKTNRDYAIWDDTYRFAQDGNQEYIDLNLGDEYLANLGINFSAVIDDSGQIRVVKNIDLTEGKESPLPFEFDELLSNYPALIQDKVQPGSRKGIAVLGDQVMLVSSEPVYDSMQSMPMAGSFIMGAYLDQAKIDALSSLAKKKIHLWLADQPLPFGPEKVRSEIVSGDEVATSALSEEVIAGYQMLEDLNGRREVMLQVDNQRTLNLGGATIATHFSASILVLGLVIAAVEYRLVSSFTSARKGQKQALQRFGTIFNQSSDAILIADEGGKILSANPASLKMLKLDDDATRAITLRDILGDEAGLLPQAGVTGEPNGSRVTECRRQVRDGSYVDLEMSMSAIQDIDARAYCVIMRDVTARKEAQQALQVSEERYRLAAQGANDGLWDWDISANQVFYSSRWKSMLGYQDGEIACSPNEWFDRVHQDDRIQLRAKLDEYLNKRGEQFEYEHRMLHKDGAYRWMLSRGVAVWNSSGFAERMAGSLTDVTRRKEIEEQLRHDALHDKLTGLGNRTLLVERLKHACQRQKRMPETRYAVLFLDFDRFKFVNDTYGHQVGDRILIETSRRLEGNLRAVDTVARVTGLETVVRVAGDEFVILLEDIHIAEDAEKVADRVLQVLAQPYVLNDIVINLSASIGIVVSDRPYEQPEDIIRDADIAMYHAKQQGGNTRVLFSQAMYDVVSARMQLEADLRRAVENQEFVLHYQPIYALLDDRVIGFEALVRWNHPDRGLLLPKEFIELAEDTGLIVPMGYDILRQACTQVKHWQSEYKLASQMIVSVNLSARQLASPDLLARIKSILDETAFDPNCLWLEITETVLIEKLELVRHVLVELRTLGIHIEIDDFGVGYSSLSYLQHLPIDGFKIDQSFINEITGSGQQIVNTLVELGRNLRLVQVAEGVETAVQKDYLRKLACEYMQGYLMARPMCAERMESFLRELRVNRSGAAETSVCAACLPLIGAPARV